MENLVPAGDPRRHHRPALEVLAEGMIEAPVSAGIELGQACSAVVAVTQDWSADWTDNYCSTPYRGRITVRTGIREIPIK